MGTNTGFLKSKAQHEGRVRAIFKNPVLVPTSTGLILNDLENLTSALTLPNIGTLVLIRF